MLDEGTRLERGQRLVEAQHEGGVDPGGGEQGELLRETARSRAPFGAQQAQGLRSNVTATTRAPASSAATRARSITARWPECTPSNLPIATTLGPNRPAPPRVVEDDHQLGSLGAPAPRPACRTRLRGIHLFGALAASVRSHHRPTNGSTSGTQK
jgi:hypothetical protein